MDMHYSDTDLEVTVESLGGLGDGIASYNGKPLFVAKSCVGDRLRVRIVHENHDGYQGIITEVLSGGEHRREAPCVYFSECGGCSLQQLQEEHYRAFKTRMLASAVARSGYDMPADILFLPTGTRRRVEFKVGGGTLAFHAPRSHRPVAVEHCLILTPALQALIAPLNEVVGDWSGLFSVGLTQADVGIDMMLTFRDSIPALALEAVCAQLGIARVCVRTREGKAKILHQAGPVEMLLGDKRVALPPEAFLQATAEGQAALTQAVLEGVMDATLVVDLFCGIGTYSFPLSARAKVHAVEGDGAMVAAAKAAGLSAEQRDLFKSPLTAKELARFDAAVINPPRAGAKAQCEQLVASGISRVVMVSCNPASFARDAALFNKNGFRLTRALGIDQFVFSQHLEIVGIFHR